MTWLDALRRRWNDHQIGFAFGWVLPVFTGFALLYGLRLARRGWPSPVWATPDLFRPLLLFGAGLAGLGLLYLGLSESRRDNHQRLAILQLAFVPVVALEVFGHAFFMSTGSSLDAALLSRGLRILKNQPAIIWSETRPQYLFYLGLLAAGSALCPWLFVRGGDMRDDRETPGGLEAVGWGTAALALIGGGFVPSFVVEERWFSRPSTLNVGVSFVRDLRETWRARPSIDSPAEDLELGRTKEAAGSEHPEHVAFIILESVRARSTGIYNPDRETTPYLADLAEDSTVGQRAYAVMPHTSKALVAMLCGIEPSLRMELDALRGIPARCLPALLNDHDYRTVFFQAATNRFEDRRTLLDRMDYDVFRPLESMDPEGFEPVNYFGLEDDVMLEPSRKWLKRQKEKTAPFFATYLTVTPHHPYTVPSRYGLQSFASEPGRLNRYLNTVYYLDRFVEKLIAQYKELGLYEETLFVIASDHGEAFGEHGHYHHDSVIYEEGIRTVLMIHDPTTSPPYPDVTHNITHLDLAPTVADRLGFEVARGAFRGTSIDALSEERPIYASCYFERRCMTRIVGPHKYVYQFGKAPNAFYDLEADPGEHQDILHRRDDAETWRRDLLRWRQRINAMYLGE